MNPGMKKILFLGLLFVGLPLGAMQQTPSLSQFTFHGAGVMPYTIWPSKPNHRYIMLSREAGGNNKGTWDAFGGARDPHEHHPVLTASREFAEETAYTIFSPQQARSYIDVNTGNTIAVVAHTQGALYLTYIDPVTMKTLRDNFYVNRAQATSWKFKEKDALAWVRWDRLEQAISNAPTNHNVTVVADVIQHNGTSVRQTITLRPFFVKMLRPYFTNQPYTLGKHPVIRFY